MGPSTRWTPDLYNGVRHHPQLNWGLSSNHNLLTTSSKQSIQQWWLGFPNGNPNHEILKQMRGEMKLLRWRCRSWPSPSILQRSTSLSGRKRRSMQFGGSAVAWKLVMVELPKEEEGGGIYTPLQKLAVC
jgi:hypothetical protein